MQIYAKYQTRVVMGELTMVQFDIEDHNSKVRTDSLEKGKIYKLEVSEAKSKRSLEQNRLLWKIIGDIVERDKSLGDEWDVYIALLKSAKCKCKSYIVQDDEAIEILRGACRAVEVVGTTTIKDKVFKVVKVYEGSSKFNTKEMTTLIETAMSWASEYGLVYEEVNYE